MNEGQNSSPAIEPERYELHAARLYVFDLTRRDLFKFLGAGALILCANAKTSAFQESGRGQRRLDDMPKDIGAWLHIGENGAVAVFTGKVEVGQNIRTSLTQAVAEELGIQTSQIKVVMGDTLLTPFDMGTFGSRTTPIMNLQLRKAAAAAREMLKDLAAAKLECPARTPGRSRWKSFRLAFEKLSHLRRVAKRAGTCASDSGPGDSASRGGVENRRPAHFQKWKAAPSSLAHTNIRPIKSGPECCTGK